MKTIIRAQYCWLSSRVFKWNWYLIGQRMCLCVNHWFIHFIVASTPPPVVLSQTHTNPIMSDDTQWCSCVVLILLFLNFSLTRFFFFVSSAVHPLIQVRYAGWCWWFNVSVCASINLLFHLTLLRQKVPNQLVGAPLITDVTLICNVEASPKAINYWQRENGKIMNRKIFNFSFLSRDF